MLQPNNMTILRQQTEHNHNAYFGNMVNMTISQSFFVDMPFTLDSVSVWYTAKGDDPSHDVRVRCEIRKAHGPDNLLDLNGTILDNSAWVEDVNLVVGEVVHTLNGLSYGAGWYWFNIATNRIIVLDNIALGCGQTGTYLEKYLKAKDGSGIYRIDRSLYYKINGTLSGVFPTSNTYAFNQFVITTIRDET